MKVLETAMSRQSSPYSSFSI